MLEKMNPGRVSFVELDETQRFKYLFFALGACIEGFNSMRKVIIVDATSIKNVYGGVLIVASAKDPDHHHYPIAFGVVDSENNASWTWFFSKLKSIIPDFTELVFCSDRHQSLIMSISTVYPLSHHGYCIYHLSQNVKLSCKNVNRDLVATTFMQVAKAYTESEFEKLYADFIKRFPAAVESINGVFRFLRAYALLPMIDAIVAKLAECVTGVDGSSYVVDLKNKTCYCKQFDIDRYPYLHAIDVAMEAAKNAGHEINEIQLHELCSKYYWMEQWALGYSRTIYPVPIMSMWIVPDNVRALVVFPKFYVIKRGRKPTKRIKSTGEHGRKKKKSTIASWFESQGSQS
ncbi:uncharacterized protein LOC111832369 [Capsella rubella]|uniref:uncharacterized protein LOC111832369 n=1 Tax=Capsella rubella TaxID=81985 RepID=UPI000CD4ADFD|nr:uncharacterized protein LOC111832369 [Capsella rubella]